MRIPVQSFHNQHPLGVHILVLENSERPGYEVQECSLQRFDTVLLPLLPATPNPPFRVQYGQSRLDWSRGRSHEAGAMHWSPLNDSDSTT